MSENLLSIFARCSGQKVSAEYNKLDFQSYVFFQNECNLFSYSDQYYKNKTFLTKQI